MLAPLARDSALAALLFLVPASAQTPGNFAPGESSGLSAHLNSQLATKADGVVPPSRPSDPVRAMDYGTCTWDAGHDVGACINAAIAVAAARGGATVVIPAGTYGQSTPIVQQTSGVHLQGAGVGAARDNIVPNLFRAITRLQWIGTVGATMLLIEPPSTVSLYSADVTGIVFDCANRANVCAKIVQTSYSTFDIGVSEPILVGAWLSTEPAGFADAPGTQHNDIWISARSTSIVNSPTGILLDSGVGSNWNTSYNRFHSLFAWYNKGDGIVFGNSDNNIIYDVLAYADPTVGSGAPMVFANTAYTMPNGMTVNGQARYNATVHTGANGVVTGFQSGSTITAGTNAGTAAPATISLTTNSGTPFLNPILNFASTTGVVSGMLANCGGWASGIVPKTPVQTVTPTALVLAINSIKAVANGAVCTFGYAVTKLAVPGTYTITATGAATFSITAPAGGHSQTGVAYAGGVVSFTDLLLPLTGTPAPGDTWTMTVPFPADYITLSLIDQGNGIAPPLFEAGASGFSSMTGNAYVTPYGGTGNVVMAPVNGSEGSVTLGGGFPAHGATNSFAAAIGGAGASASGFGAVTVGGHNLVAGGLYSYASGDTTTAGGTVGRTGGSSSTDRSRYAADCWAGGQFAVQGDAQVCKSMLRGTGATGSAFRLTADGLAASTINCINIPNNAAHTLAVTINAFDHTAVANNEAWLQWSGLLTRGANAASTTLTMATTPTPITNGTVAGSAIAATADTTNGCLNVSFTPPTSNTDTWNVVARVETVEVQ